MGSVPIRMPKMSMTMTEGEVTTWALQPGERVDAGDVVCEVMTDKVDMEVESPATGTLREIVVASGAVAVGDTIGWLETEGDEDVVDLLDFADPAPPAGTPPSADSPPADPPAPSGEDSPPPASKTPQGPVRAVPRARALARERGIDLATLTGTGPDGVIAVGDVEAATTPAAPLNPVASAQSPVSPAPPSPPAVASTRAEGIRRAVARKMTESAGVPQFTVWRDLHLEVADAARQGVSWTTVLMQAYARALRRVPRLLTRWDGTDAVDTGAPVVALAVDTPHGLLVPSFSEPDICSAQQLDADIRATVQAARDGRMEPARLAPANASLSNLGGLGADRFQALVTPPQASVLAFGAITRRPVAVPGGLGAALMVSAGLSVDHRAADGADAARLLAEMAQDLG